ncbi:tRNA (N(6)-L-threonylcarbamoyladenosine(37)-C(2))-methylthiotransferase MtaB, partial [Candidatus Falkowbacteria bacterium]
MNKNNFKIYTLGCKVNQYDSYDLSCLMERDGFKLGEENVDVAVVNSCAVTKTAIYKSKRMLNKARRENPEAKLILMGCWPKVYKDELKKLKIDLVWEVGNLNKLADKIKGLKIIKFKKQQFFKIQKPKKIRSRYFLKIQDGCDQYCSYCIIPYARGKPKSRAQTDVLEEIKKAVRAGYREIVLSGIHLGRYGNDDKKRKINNTKELPELIKKAVEIKNIGRIRLSSIEVNEVSDELLEFSLNNKKICNHFHVPLQSGCNKILKKMNRPYTKEFYKNKINKIRRIDSRAAISTDVIVGFPGEDEDDFKETYNFIKSIKFSKIHVFPYSRHEKTAAYKMPAPVNREVIKNRSKRLKILGDNTEKEYGKLFSGQEVNVVVEKELPVSGKSTGKKIFGKTEHYLNIIFQKKDIIKYFEPKNKKDLIGKIVKI